MSAPTPVVASLTTLPSRIGLLEPTLWSLCHQTRRPDRIVLAIPPSSRREKRGYELPDFLVDGTFPSGLIEVVRTTDDYGPGTKLLGAMPVLPRECVLVVVDDDVEYAPHVVEGLATAQLTDRTSSFSYYTYAFGGLTVGQGCDGFSFWSPNLQGIEAFAEEIVDRPECFHHDDLWISFFLQRAGIRICGLEAPGDVLVYRQLDRANPLQSLDGDLDRNDLNVRGLQHLMRHAHPTPAMRRRWLVHEAARRSGATRVLRKSRRVLSAGHRRPAVSSNATETPPPLDSP